MSLIVTDPTTGVVTQITGGDTNTDIFTDDDEVDVTDTTPAGSTKDTESIQAHAKSGDSYVDQSSLSLSVKGSPSPGVTIDFLNMPGSIDTGFNSNDDELPQATAGNSTETDTFSSGDTDLVTDSGHLNISDVVNTDDGNGNTVSISESDNTIFGIAGTGTISNSDSGQEVVVDVNGHKTADTEGDTDTFAAEIDPFSNETTNANNKAVTVDPKTSLKTTTTYNDNGSTDNIQERDIDGFTDIHSASLTNPGTDVDSGTAGITDQEQTNTNINCEVDLSGSMPTGGTVSLMNKFLLKTNSQDTESFGDVLATNGTNTDTTSLTGKFVISDLYESVSGSVKTTDANTGITTTDLFANVVEDGGGQKLAETNTAVIPLNGTPSDVSGNDDSGRLSQVWSLQDIQFQTNSAGALVGNVVTKSDFGSDTETETIGVTTYQGTTDTVTSSTTPAGSAPPNDPPVSAPGGLLPSTFGGTETFAADAPPVPAESKQATVTSGNAERSILQNTWDFFFGRGAWLSDPWSQEYGHAYAPESIANPVAPVALFGQNMAALNDTMKENGVYTRAEGVVQFGTSIPEGFGGGAMMIFPEPILTKAGGAIILAVALDNGRVGFYKMIWGKNAETTVRTVAVSTAEALGADKNSAQWIGFGADVSSNVGSGVIAYRFAKAGHLADLADDVTPSGRGIVVTGQIGSLPTGSESNLVKEVYLSQVDTTMFKVKLDIHNSIKSVTTLGQSKWVTPAEIKAILESKTTFRVGASTVHQVENGFVIGGRESIGYLNQTVTHHEMLHIGQYLRNPNIIDTRPIGYIHEVIPSFVGTPEIYGGVTIIIGGSAYWYLTEKN